MGQKLHGFCGALGRVPKAVAVNVLADVYEELSIKFFHGLSLFKKQSPAIAVSPNIGSNTEAAQSVSRGMKKGAGKGALKDCET
jgi:hypothetical protein